MPHCPSVKKSLTHFLKVVNNFIIIMHNQLVSALVGLDMCGHCFRNISEAAHGKMESVVHLVRPLDQAILDMNETQYLKSIHVTCKRV